MVCNELFTNYELPIPNNDNLVNTSTYVHPFILKQLLEFSKELRTMGLWKVVNDSVIVLEIKGYKEPIYIQLLTQRNEDIALFIEGAEKYASFMQHYQKHKNLSQLFPMVGMIKFTDKVRLEKYDRDLLAYLNVNCKGNGTYPMIRMNVNGKLVFPDSQASLLMARAIECAYRMFVYMYNDNIRKMYMSGLLMYQSYNETEDVYEYKMAKLTYGNK